MSSTSIPASVAPSASSYDYSHSLATVSSVLNSSPLSSSSPSSDTVASTQTTPDATVPATLTSAAPTPSLTLDPGTLADIQVMTERRLSFIVGAVTGASGISAWLVLWWFNAHRGVNHQTLSTGCLPWGQMGSGLTPKSIILQDVTRAVPTGPHKAIGSVYVSSVQELRVYSSLALNTEISDYVCCLAWWPQWCRAMGQRPNLT